MENCNKVRGIDEQFLEQLEQEDAKIERNKIIKQPFGWMGGKSRSLKHILPHLPASKRYVEVFGGSGIVLLNKPKCPVEVFNDRYSAIVDFYKVLQDKLLVEQLIARLDIMPASRELFLDSRDTWCDSSDIVERAAKWYYSIQQSFGCKGRNLGRDKGRTMARTYNHFPIFREVNERIRNVLLENLDWKQLCNDYDSHDTVFYMDPPYLADISCTSYKHNFTRQDHRILLDFIWGLDGYVAVSSYGNELYDAEPWDEVHEYDILITMDGMGVDENTNRKAQGKRSIRKERLYIKWQS